MAGRSKSLIRAYEGVKDHNQYKKLPILISNGRMDDFGKEKRTLTDDHVKRGNMHLITDHVVRGNI